MAAAPTLTTVLGSLPPADAGVTDGHQHAWIEPSGAVADNAPQLNDRAVVESGLCAYRAAGGGSLLDCQPGGCGRNAVVLAELSRRTGVSIVTCTGFHLRRYYPPDYWLWSPTSRSAIANAATGHFVSELRERVAESKPDAPIRAGFIKIACTADLAETPGFLLEAAAEASRVTGAALLVHTEQGAAAEEIVERLTALGAQHQHIVLCHMDKRSDAGLHRSLADSGVALEYDTFFRPKYDPDHNLWPLLEQMLADGYQHRLVLGTDLADATSWHTTGPAGLLLTVAPRLQAMGCSDEVVAALVGKNIVARLCGSQRAARYEPVVTGGW